MRRWSLQRVSLQSGTTTHVRASLLHGSYGDVLRNNRKNRDHPLEISRKSTGGHDRLITIGPRFGRRQKLCLGDLDRVEVKRVGDLSPETSNARARS